MLGGSGAEFGAVGPPNEDELSHTGLEYVQDHGTSIIYLVRECVSLAASICANVSASVASMKLQSHLCMHTHH